MPYVTINGKSYDAIDDTAALRKAICDAMPKTDANSKANTACAQDFSERYGYMTGGKLSADSVKKGVKSAVKYVAKTFSTIFKL